MILSLFLTTNLIGQFSQNVLTESWIQSGGQGIGIKNAATIDDQRNVYVAGATNIGVNNTDVLVQKFTPDGGLTWQQTYSGTANLNDGATAIFVDQYYNVYITGTVVNDTSKGLDILVIKYSSNGTQQWVFTHHGSDINIDDVGAAITGNPSGSSILVTGMSGHDQNMYDFKTFSLSSVDGSVIWTQSYDYNTLTEIPKRIFVDANYVFVMGASQDSQNHWEIATVQYDLNVGTFLNDERTNSSTVTGIDEISDYTLDNQGNIYIVGSILTNNGYDIAVYKLDSVLNLVWDNYYDINGLDDKGNGIEFYNGDLYLTGYSSTTNLGKETLS